MAIEGLALGLIEKLPRPYAETARVWLFGLTKVPMLFWLRPVVLDLNERRCEIKIPLTRRSKNHLRSMYFGALAAGADCAGGLMAMAMIQRSGKRIDLSFKDFKANFLKRAEADTHFICEQGPEIAKLIESVLASGERENLTVLVQAFCPKAPGDAGPVAEFELTLSLKRRA